MFSWYYIEGILIQSCYTLLIVLGLSILTGYTGMFSFGHAGFVCIGAYVSILCTMAFGLPYWLSLIIAGLAAMLLGAGLGKITLNLKGDYFCIATLGVGEALQCPTILNNGFGGHRIEGIGDKHIPWIHNVKNTDMAIAIDDEDSQRLLRLFNTPEGQKYMKDELGMSAEEVQKMTWLGISGIANVLCCIKMAKYYELTENDVVATVLTDSAVMSGSRIEELNEMHGAYNVEEAKLDHNLHMLGLKTDNLMELTYTDRKRIHNLKYYTWVEQQARDVKDLNALWYDTKGTWDAVHAQAKELDELINAFNDEVGLLKAL